MAHEQITVINSARRCSTCELERTCPRIGEYTGVCDTYTPKQRKEVVVQSNDCPMQKLSNNRKDKINER